MVVRLTGATTLHLSIGHLEIEPEAYRVRLDGRLVPLSPAQFELLVFLVENRERVVSRDELARAGGLGHERSVDVALSSLRRGVGCDFIRNVRNRGWILDPDA